MQNVILFLIEPLYIVTNWLSVRSACEDILTFVDTQESTKQKNFEIKFQVILVFYRTIKGHYRFNIRLSNSVYFKILHNISNV